MLDKFQTKLLLKYPLVWNTKLIPMLIVGIVINALYYLIGYMVGTMDFTQNNDYKDDVTFFTFSVVISILALIIWLVFYFRNNSFKAFYPKTNNSLFYEWVHIFIIILSLSSFYFFYQWGKASHQRSYYTYPEIVKNGNLIIQMDYFIDAPLGEGDMDSLQMGLRKDGTRTKENGVFYKDSVTIYGIKYHKNALINREAEDRYYDKFPRGSNMTNDSIMKKLLADRNEAELKKKFQEYFALVKAHNLKTNLTPERLLKLNYHPESGYMDYELVNPRMPSEINAATIAADGGKGYSKFYVEQATLKDTFRTLLRAYEDPVIEKDVSIFIFYFSLILSLLIFAFRVTSGKNWLIAAVALGVLNIVFGLFSAITGGLLYLSLMLVCFALITGYLILILFNDKVKGNSGAFVCMFLFSFTWFVPALYFFGHDIGVIDDYSWKTKMYYINFIFVVIVFFFVSRLIKKWRALPEQ
ncbi:hypothetical protein BAX97_07335 [Elizabethkingia meningoseptica]|uniref:hypothetical protein n=1 Tax=Elizabethkingia meningoseptica TaxID=238 RepID=UPI00099A752A|nr:hypothetical protein [Elizabethkingia meningoseptica]OPC28445.1 hypothetical protein BAX97_07335 [Elizabethkingia meningoseptica]